MDYFQTLKILFLMLVDKMKFLMFKIFLRAKRAKVKKQAAKPRARNFSPQKKFLGKPLIFWYISVRKSEFLKNIIMIKKIIIDSQDRNFKLLNALIL